MPTAAEIIAKADPATGPEPANYRYTDVAAGSLGEMKTLTYRAGPTFAIRMFAVRFIANPAPLTAKTGGKTETDSRLPKVADPGQAQKDPIKMTVSHLTASGSRISQLR